MRIGLPFLALAGLVGVTSACLLDTTNDDDGAETGNATASSTASSTAGSDAGSTAGSTAGSGTAAETAASTAADDTAGAGGVCGWGSTGDPAVPEGYVCGGDGEDPSGMVPQLCPEAVDLQVGGGCNGIEGTGCCDAQGNAWFCGNDGSGEALARLEC